MDDFDIVFEPEDDVDIVFEPHEVDLGAEVACTRCGTVDHFVFVYFRDRLKNATAAVGCRRCGLCWPIQMRRAMADEVLAHRGEVGVEIEGPAQ